MATFVAGLVAVVIFMMVNLLWKISLHMAFISASVTILVVNYGKIAVWTVVFIPLLAWARMELKLHSLAQVIAGAMLAAGIVPNNTKR